MSCVLHPAASLPQAPSFHSVSAADQHDAGPGVYTCQPAHRHLASNQHSTLVERMQRGRNQQMQLWHPAQSAGTDSSFSCPARPLAAGIACHSDNTVPQQTSSPNCSYTLELTPWAVPTGTVRQGRPFPEEGSQEGQHPGQEQHPGEEGCQQGVRTGQEGRQCRQEVRWLAGRCWWR